MASSVTVRDNGYQALMKALREGGAGIELTVGIHEEEGGEPTKGGLSVAEVAELNEFGSPGGRIPARPSITAWADENATRVPGDLKKSFERSIETRSDPFSRIDQLAQKYAGEVQGKIADGIPPPNAESTVRKKGSSTPLINTGQFRAAIRGKVERK